MSDKDPDPEKKIYDWCSHIPVPRWKDKDAYNSCFHCRQKMDGFLTTGNKHNCRLCGEMFCSACTQKFHVPLIYRVKNKEGPARVCMSCVESCLAEKDKAEKAKQVTARDALLSGPPLPGTQIGHRKSILEMMQKTNEIAPPEVWEPEGDTVECRKCRTKGKDSKQHNCRTCGLIFCSKCTTKMDIPAFFEKKKGKTGPYRVCDSCRFKIIQGAKLVEKLSNPARNALAVPGSVQTEQSRRFSLSYSRAASCRIPGCTAPCFKDDLCEKHDANAKVEKEKKEKEQERIVVVQKENSDTILARLSLPTPLTTLAAIDILFKKTAPQGENYIYILRGEPVPEAFWDVVLQKHLGSIIYIKYKSKTLLASMTRSFATTSVPLQNNPFKRDENAAMKAAAEEEQRKLAAAQQKKKVEFHRPQLPAGFKCVPSKKSPAVPPPLPNANKTGPPPPPLPASTSSAPPPLPNADIETTLKYRAKNLFGAS